MQVNDYNRNKMEATHSEAGEKNRLYDILSQNELSKLPDSIVKKINNILNEQLLVNLTSKALNETGSQIGNQFSTLESSLLERTAKYESVDQKHITTDETISDFKKKIQNLNGELEKACTKIKCLDNENAVMKSSRDVAIHEKNGLSRIVERRDIEIERLTSYQSVLSQQLRAAINAKCDALALNDDIQRKELALHDREKRIEQEKILLNSHISELSQEVHRLTLELQTVRLSNTSNIVMLQTQLAEKVEELISANAIIAELNDQIQNVQKRAENLSKRLFEQREIEDRMTKNFKIEADGASKLAHLYKSMCDDTELKCSELTDGFSELQKIFNEAVNKYGELETKSKQMELDYEEEIKKKNEIIASLKSELEHANNLLKACNLDVTLSNQSPSAATVNKVLKSNMSLVEVYSQLVKVTDNLTQEKEENIVLTKTLEDIIQLIEEFSPLLKKQKAEHEEATESNATLLHQIEFITIEYNSLKDKYSKTTKLANQYNLEKTKLTDELGDLGRQVCFLLKEVEQIYDGQSSQNASGKTNSSDISKSSRAVSKNIVTFSNIEELQANNQKLLSMVSQLYDECEDLKRQEKEFKRGEMHVKIKSLTIQVSELTDTQERLTNMINELMEQRDMFKKLYHGLMKENHQEATVAEAEIEKIADTSDDNVPKQPNPDHTNFEIKYKDTEHRFKLLKEQHKTYQEEKITNEKLLYNQIDSMRQEISKLMAMNSKMANTIEHDNERFHLIQTNIAIYKRQIASLEQNNKVYSLTIARHEVSLQHLRDKAVSEQNTAAAAEIQLEKLKTECKLVKEAEMLLKTENDILNSERQGQSLLLSNIELIKASLERVEAESRTSENAKNLKEQLTELKIKLDEVEEDNEKLKVENVKAKQVLKLAKGKIIQLTELNNRLSKEFDDSRTKMGAVERNTQEEKEVRLALNQSQYEGRLSRIEKERDEANAEKTREVEAFVQKGNTLQRQLLSSQMTTEKTSSELLTESIKAKAGVAQLSDETPLASIPPMREVGPAAPHDVHSPEHTPAPSAPSTSTQDIDTSEAGMTARASDSGSYMVFMAKLIEQSSSLPTGCGAVPETVLIPLSGTATSTARAIAHSAGVSTSQPWVNARPAKRALLAHPVAAKRTKVQGLKKCNDAITISDSDDYAESNRSTTDQEDVVVKEEEDTGEEEEESGEEETESGEEETETGEEEEDSSEVEVKKEETEDDVEDSSTSQEGDDDEETDDGGESSTGEVCSRCMSLQGSDQEDE